MIIYNDNIINNIKNFDDTCDSDSKGESRDKIKLFVDSFVSSSSSIEYFHNFVSKG
tara:strand:+ start:335 stop:502 length:168 start_codon:yes stop_codon:yes gene_type:complete